MKRTLNICVLFAVLATILAPAAGFCVPIAHPQQHACCAQESQLSTSCCQSQTAPTPALTDPAGISAIAKVAQGSTLVELPLLQAAVSAVHQLHTSPSILLPATILRT